MSISKYRQDSVRYPTLFDVTKYIWHPSVDNGDQPPLFTEKGENAQATSKCIVLGDRVSVILTDGNSIKAKVTRVANAASHISLEMLWDSGVEAQIGEQAEGQIGEHPTDPSQEQKSEDEITNLQQCSPVSPGRSPVKPWGWVEIYSPSNRPRHKYYRYAYVPRGSGCTKHTHIRGGDINSSESQRRKAEIEEAIARQVPPEQISLLC